VGAPAVARHATTHNAPPNNTRKIDEGSGIIEKLSERPEIPSLEKSVHDPVNGVPPFWRFVSRMPTALVTVAVTVQRPTSTNAVKPFA
jgi:hypothetical protein